MSEANSNRKAKEGAAIKTGRAAGWALSSMALPALICVAGAGLAWVKLSAEGPMDVSVAQKSDAEALRFAKEAVETSLRLSASRFDLDRYSAAPYFTPESFARWSETLSRSGLKESLQGQAGSMEARVEDAAIVSEGVKEGAYSWRVTARATVVVKNAKGETLSTSQWSVGVDESQRAVDLAPKGIAIERLALAPAVGVS